MNMPHTLFPDLEGGTIGFDLKDILEMKDSLKEEKKHLDITCLMRFLEAMEKRIRDS